MLLVHLVNMLSNMSSDKFCLNNFGIGGSDGETTLLVPKHNWGGAYIDDRGNSYSDEVLAGKDGFSVVPISIYFNDQGLVKLNIGLGKGKKKFDKRETQKMKDWNKAKQRLLKNS